MNRKFWGYRRENGRVGIRNHVILLPLDDLSNAACQAVANNIKGKSRKGALSDAQVFVLPIPSTEVSAYGLEQNPGY